MYQERTHKEIQQKLAELAVYGDEAAEFTAWLVVENYLNEERFAKVYASSKFRLKKWGRRKIAFELKNKGLSPNCLKIGLAEITDQEYTQTIIDLIHKKQAEYSRHTNPLIIKQKVLNYLLSKGYTLDEVLSEYKF